jgi:hypothetical protein
MMRFHPSSLAALMADAKSIDPVLLTPELLAISKKKIKDDADKALLEPLWNQTLSAGAKTYLKAYASEFLFSYCATFSSKETDKGNACEQDSIDLYNAVSFTHHAKNAERRNTDLLSGECDIYVPGTRTIDIKTCWSLKSFPLLSEDCHDTTYEFQGRAYMHLWDVPEHEVAFCMVSTPEDIRPRWEPEDIHQVDHHVPSNRITRIVYKRDMALEQKMLIKCRAAQQYLAQIVERFNTEHQ